MLSPCCAGYRTKKFLHPRKNVLRIGFQLSRTFHFCRNYQRLVLVHALNLHHHSWVDLWDCWLSWSRNSLLAQLWILPCMKKLDKRTFLKAKLFIWPILLQLLCSVVTGAEKEEGSQGFKPGWEWDWNTLGKAGLPWAINWAIDAEKRLRGKTEKNTTASGVWGRIPGDSWCTLVIPDESWWFLMMTSWWCHCSLCSFPHLQIHSCLCFQLSVLIPKHRHDFVTQIYT